MEQVCVDFSNIITMDGSKGTKRQAAWAQKSGEIG